MRSSATTAASLRAAGYRTPAYGIQAYGAAAYGTPAEATTAVAARAPGVGVGTPSGITALADTLPANAPEAGGAAYGGYAATAAGAATAAAQKYNPFRYLMTGQQAPLLASVQAEAAQQAAPAPMPEDDLPLGYAQGGVAGEDQDDAGPPDMSDQYNTGLSAADETKFQAWAKANGKQGDTYDYDLRGAYKSGAATSADGHMPDTYKKPNHPTFSDQSQYSTEKTPGGQWVAGQSRSDRPGQSRSDRPGSAQDGAWSFKPSPTNLQMHGADRLQRYFQQREPGNTLQLPGANAQRVGYAQGGIANLSHARLLQAEAQLRAAGRGGDTILAHINPREAALLRAHGGSGRINPRTGLPEFEGESGGDSPGTGSSGGDNSGNAGNSGNSGGTQGGSNQSGSVGLGTATSGPTGMSGPTGQTSAPGSGGEGGIGALGGGQAAVGGGTAGMAGTGSNANSTTGSTTGGIGGEATMGGGPEGGLGAVGGGQAATGGGHAAGSQSGMTGGGGEGASSMSGMMDANNMDVASLAAAPVIGVDNVGLGKAPGMAGKVGGMVTGLLSGINPGLGLLGLAAQNAMGLGPTASQMGGMLGGLAGLAAGPLGGLAGAALGQALGGTLGAHGDVGTGLGGPTSQSSGGGANDGDPAAIAANLDGELRDDPDRRRARSHELQQLQQLQRQRLAASNAGATPASFAQGGVVSRLREGPREGLRADLRPGSIEAHEHKLSRGSGLIHGASGGRADKLPVRVPRGSYVVPADVVSGLGGGNTMAGAKALKDAMMAGASLRAPAAPPRRRGFAEGGIAGAEPRVPLVPIQVSAGEFVVHPGHLAALGDGNPQAGAQMMDQFVGQVRRGNAQVAQGMPPPR